MKRLRVAAMAAVFGLFSALVPTVPAVQATAVPEGGPQAAWRAEAPLQRPPWQLRGDRETRALPSLPAATATPAQGAAGRLTMLDVAAGESISAALRSDGTVWAWGQFWGIELGRPEEDVWYYAEPVKVLDLPPIAQIAAQGKRVVALAQDGTVWEFGRKPGERKGRLPARVPGLSGVTAIAVSPDHGLALTESGTVYAWGKNDLGQLGDQTHEDRVEPVRVAGLTGVTKVTAGPGISLAVAEGTLVAWGRIRDRPVWVDSFDSLGGVQDVAVQENGWGPNQVIVVTATGAYQFPEHAPRNYTAVPGSAGATAVAAGRSAFYLKAASGEWLGWERDAKGELKAPVWLGRPEHVAAGVSHVLLQYPTGVYAAGGNHQGDLGDGTMEPSTSLVTVHNLPLDTTAPAWEESAIVDLNATGLADDTALRLSWAPEVLSEADELDRYRITIDGVLAAVGQVIDRHADAPHFETTRDHSVVLEVSDRSGNWSRPMESRWWASYPVRSEFAAFYGIYLRYDRPLQPAGFDPQDCRYDVGGKVGTPAEVIFVPSQGYIGLILPDLLPRGEGIGISCGFALRDLNGRRLPAIQTTVRNVAVEDEEPPQVRSAITSSRGQWLYVTFDRFLDRHSMPAGADFTVTVNGMAQAPPMLREVLENVVTLELAHPVQAGDVVQVTYRVGEVPLLDVYGRQGAAFADRAVQNRAVPAAP